MFFSKNSHSHFLSPLLRVRFASSALHSWPAPSSPFPLTLALRLSQLRTFGGFWPWIILKIWMVELCQTLRVIDACLRIRLICLGASQECLWQRIQIWTTGRHSWVCSLVLWDLSTRPWPLAQARAIFCTACPSALTPWCQRDHQRNCQPSPQIVLYFILDCLIRSFCSHGF